MNNHSRTVELPADDEEAIRDLKKELRAARFRLRQTRRTAALTGFRSLPFGGTNVSGH
jgi:hypothetical protein